MFNTTKVCEPALSPEKMKEPSKRWFNWYKINGVFTNKFRFVTSGRIIPVKYGDIIQGETPWPSKEIAEEKAYEVQRTAVNPAHYLGAYKEGERPNG